MIKKIPWNKGLTKETDERVLKYSNTKKGKIFTEEHKNKLRKPHLIYRGKNHKGWVGDKACYRTNHAWITKNKGKAIKCEECGLDRIPKGYKIYFQWSNIDHKYRRNLIDYKQLCLVCHAKYDKQLRVTKNCI